jgi:hypothetical protein
MPADAFRTSRPPAGHETTKTKSEPHAVSWRDAGARSRSAVAEAEERTMPDRGATRCGAAPAGLACAGP